MAKVAIVTDTISCLPPHLAAEYGIKTRRSCSPAANAADEAGNLIHNLPGLWLAVIRKSAASSSSPCSTPYRSTPRSTRPSSR